MCVQGHRSLIDTSHEEWNWAGVVEPELGGKRLGNLREFRWAHLCLHSQLRSYLGQMSGGSKGVTGRRGIP